MRPPVPPPCPETGRSSYRTEAEAARFAARRAPTLITLRCEHCPYWHFRNPPSPAGRRARITEIVIGSLLDGGPGPQDRAELRELAASTVRTPRASRSSGGRRSTNELRQLLQELERDKLVTRSESTVTVLDPGGLRAWRDNPDRGTKEDQPCPESPPP